MPPSKQGNNAAILIEHFGFPAVAFVDDVINSVNDHLYTASEGISRMVEGELGVSEEGEQGTHMFETLMESSIDKAFDVFELYTLQHTLSIHPDVNIELPHYETLDLSIQAEEEAELDAAISRIRSTLLKKNALLHQLDHLTSQLHQEKSKIQSRLEETDYLTQSIQGQGILGLGETVQYLSQNLDRLSALSIETQETWLAGQGLGSIPPSPRLVYLDTAVKWHVQQLEAMERDGYLGLTGEEGRESRSGGRRKRSSTLGIATSEYQLVQSKAKLQALSMAIQSLDSTSEKSRASGNHVPSETPAQSPPPDTSSHE